MDNSTTVQARVALNFAKKPSPHNVGESQRREYHLTAKDGNLHSQTMVLNGNILSVNSAGDIPSLNPIYVDSSKPITVRPLSIVFAHIPDAAVKACS